MDIYSIIPGHQRVLIAPLNWGLGHATRCIPIIRTLRQLGHEILIAADGGPLRLLQEEFKDQKHIEFLRFPGLDISYDKGNVSRSILWHLPSFLLLIYKEHRQLQDLIEKNHITWVISDNRFGLWTSLVPCVYITHQLMIKAPRSLKWTEGLLHHLHLRFIKRYTFCWIPDYKEDNGLSGDLSHFYPLPANARFIGPLSRFAGLYPFNIKESELFHTVAVISGPEPQRTDFEDKVVRELLKKGTKALVVCGRPDTGSKRVIQNVTLVPHLSSRLLMTHLIHARRVICRCGYSSVMDLHILHKRAEITPTKGQTEQEYLYDFLIRKNLHDRWLEDGYIGSTSKAT
jgi:uncharacterized protein (TIGR00661 family)